jgi:hypothetical protein
MIIISMIEYSINFFRLSSGANLSRHADDDLWSSFL